MMGSWAELRVDLLPGEVPRFLQPWDTGPPPPPPARNLIRAWWPAEGFSDRFPEICAALADRAGIGAPAWETIQDEDWGETWKRSFHRLIVSPRLAVSPPWEAQPAQRGGTCLDVGCGSGVLALAAARLGMTAWGVDTDRDAVRSSREAAALNGLEARFDDTPLERVQGTFDLVVANLFAGSAGTLLMADPTARRHVTESGNLILAAGSAVISALAPQLRRVTGRHLVLAGILADRAHLVEAALSGMRQVSRRQDGDWVSMEYAA